MTSSCIHTDYRTAIERLVTVKCRITYSDLLLNNLRSQFLQWLEKAQRSKSTYKTSPILAQI
jgi:hypothetical protein